jgi:DNA-binding NtrC family response regulator
MTAKRPRILVVDDEEIARRSFTDWLAEEGCAVEGVPDGVCAIRRMGEGGWAVLLVDLKTAGGDGLQVLAEARRLLPDAAVILMTAHGGMDAAAQAMRMGAAGYLVKPFGPEELTHLVRKILAQQALHRENILLRRALKRQWRFHDLVSKSPRMQAVFEVARSAAASHSTVLLLGETGTGKELLARAIHAESPRAEGPFVAVSCAALTETLLESELFGHERGAFTGANTWAPSSCTRSATSAPSSTSTSSGSWSSTNSGGWGGRRCCGWTPASSRRPIATCRGPWRTGASGRTSSTAST